MNNNILYYMITDSIVEYCFKLVYILVAVEHITVSLSEIFNLFYSSVEFLMLYSKNL